MIHLLEGSFHSVEDCIYQAKWGMEEHVGLLRERGILVPEANPNPTDTVQNANRVEAAM